jgi:L-2-hydroxyglutarate oxidase LhgO
MTSQVAIIGGGIVGCALARELALRGTRGIVLLEKEDGFARHTSGRNSGVLHSGYHLKPGSLKAKLCVEGARLLKDYCTQTGVPVKTTGTLVIATHQHQIATLEELLRRGMANGVPGVKILAPAEFKSLEPHAEGLAALYSPSGAVVDSAAAVLAMARQCQELGVQCLLGFAVRDIQPKGDEVELVSSTGQRLSTRHVINCAGVYADKIAHLMGVGRRYVIAPFRGEYFELVEEKRHLVHSMIYPVPDLEMPFLGIHWTRTVHDRVIVGPSSLLALGRENYYPGVVGNLKGLATPRLFRETAALVIRPRFWRWMAQPSILAQAWNEVLGGLSKRYFARHARELVPAVKPGDLRRGGSGIRAQLIDLQGRFVDDFILERTPQSTHLLNVVSPGMTSSMALARYIADELKAGQVVAAG